MGKLTGANRRRFSLELPVDLVDKIDALRAEWGLRSRGDILERLLQEIFPKCEEVDAHVISDHEDHQNDGGPTGQESRDLSFNEQGALVLTTRGSRGDLCLDRLSADAQFALIFDLDASIEAEVRPRQSGIDLPGFIRRQTDQLKRSLQSTPPSIDLAEEPLPQVGGDVLDRSLAKARDHWRELYGKVANEAVLEAAMVWLAQDIWAQIDQSESRPFTWSLACDVVANTAPSWSREPATFERVMVMAGLLEDPFSTSTLELRLPTLIRRFVHRFRKRRKGTSFQTLEHTMTLHGALNLLQLPTTPGHRLTLRQIREAYREMAMSHHPDSGGSEETMRRLNEAYQLLKELYRNE
ncbi:MAG: J domain-containing protein [Cyanobacteria bacterium]|nr:J domain-containing protein [Cyanobacteriota bacterium]MDA1246131.1 J domain-containing protein [Cyanobacteriota bacterium]